MVRWLVQIDRPFLLCLVGIVLLGLYNLASAGQPLGRSLHWSHASHIVLGILVAAFVASVPYRHFEGLAYPAFFGVIGLLLLTASVGKMVNGSRRWLDLGVFSLQTSDLAKLAVILIVAKTLHNLPWDRGGLTLASLFRPFNLSRPAVLLAGILAVSLFGEGLRPPKLEVWARSRYKPALTLKMSVAEVSVGRKAASRTGTRRGPRVSSVCGAASESPPEGQRSLRMRSPGLQPQHGRIFRAEKGWCVEPWPNSSGKLYLNETLLTTQSLLRHHDVLRFGSNDRSRVRFVDQLARARSVLPWVAVLGVLWLVVALQQQFDRGRWHFLDLVAPVDVVLLPAILILGQPDLGTALVLLLIAFTIVLYVGLRPVSLLIFVGSSLAFAVIAWQFLLQSYQKERIFTLLNPSGDLSGAGYHQHQSLIAIGSGRWLGKGHGLGTQTQLSFLPEQQTDFIFSVWAEEQGFLGSLIVVALFCGLIVSALRVAQRSRDRFGALLAVGVTAMLFWHTVVNMLMVVRLAPVVGVPLPLWSNGGSFIITTMVGVGIILNVSLRRTLF